MYRYIVDNAITYTPEDFILYRESPFACWMERLTLENPDHGIPPDAGSGAPASCVERQDELAETLRDEGRDVILVDWEAEEPARRSATLDAMRKGADFIVNGQLALGPLSGATNLLMRTSGYSDLGDYLYIPCETQAGTTTYSTFRLCFLADLLHMLQGQVPPQMLIIRGGSDVVPLQTDDHIYHYRAVKQRFMTAMREFRKHRMPDPAESSHFGRWSECAHEVLKQRALHGASDDQAEQIEEVNEPVMVAAEGSVAGVYPPAAPAALPEIDTPVAAVTSVAADARRAGDLQVNTAAGGTLAEQASRLRGGGYAEVPRPAPGHTPNLAPVMAARSKAQDQRRIGDTVPGNTRQAESRPRVDVALENLEFIGSNLRPPTLAGEVTRDSDPQTGVGISGADAPAAGHPGEAPPAYSFPEQGASLDSQRPSVPEPLGTGAGDTEVAALAAAPFELPATRREKRHPLDSFAIPGQTTPSSVIDRDDSTPIASGAERRAASPAAHFGWEAMEEEGAEPDFLEAAVERDDKADTREFSSSLITNEEYLERE
jgi:hypothetical protein